ncbi:hypothetical protein DY000_02005907 [Brassica cretica]|uniref:Pectinesterase inhibitor domain-containing protein n=1 Tax=Brassica cretica TaxID=69181 RepID=A0ABQ7BU85_BRACR|nr:hypothetical protein DY000_02005907 [Brassica cretica]
MVASSVIHEFILAGRANHYKPSLKVGSIVKVDRFEVARCSNVVGQIRSVQSSDLTKETSRVVIRLLIDPTAAAKDPNLKYDFCVQSLEQDQQSKTATSLSGLNKSYPPDTEPALRTCVKLYDDANGSLNEALMSVKSGDYRSANVHLSAARDAPSTCKDGFKEKHTTSPVTNENNVLFQKIVIPLAFTNML